MANFTIDKQLGQCNGFISVTPVLDKSGRGPYTGTMIIQSKNNPAQKKIVSLSKTFPLSKDTLTISGCASAAGNYSTLFPNSNNISISESAYFVKFSVATNTKKIKLSTISFSYIAIKVGSQYVQAGGVLVSSQVDCKSAFSANILDIPGDPGVSAKYNLEVIVGLASNTSTSDKITALTVTLFGSTDDETIQLFNGNIVQAAHDNENQLQVDTETDGYVKVFPTYSDIPEDTKQNMSFSLLFILDSERNIRIIIPNGSWNNDENCWSVSTYEISSRDDPHLNYNLSSLSIDNDELYSYKLVGVTDIVRFQFIKANGKVYLNLEKPGYYEINEPIKTNIGEFFLGPKWNYAGNNTQLDSDTPIEVYSIPEAGPYLFENEAFPEQKFTLGFINQTKEVSWHGALLITIGDYSYSSGTISDISVPFYAFGQVIKLDYTANPSSGHWVLSFNSQIYTMNYNKSVVLPIFYGSSKITLIEYSDN